MFLKYNMDGTIKVFGCTNVRKQRRLIIKSDATAPTISTEADFLISIVASKERLVVSTVDLPEAFIQTNMQGDLVSFKFEVRMDEYWIKLIQSCITSFW